MTTRYWNGQFWDKLRPFNLGMLRDLELLYRWDEQHPGEFAYYPRLCIGAGVQESGEVAKLQIWKMAEWGQQTYEDGNRSAFYRIVEHGKSVYRGEVAFPYDYWESDRTLNYTCPPIFIHQIRNGFDLRSVRKLYLRSERQGPPQRPADPPEEPEDPRYLEYLEFKKKRGIL